MFHMNNMLSYICFECVMQAALVYGAVRSGIVIGAMNNNDALVVAGFVLVSGFVAKPITTQLLQTIE